MRDDSAESTYFPCPVSPENSEATLVVRRRRIPVNVTEQSIDGFAVTTPTDRGRHITLGCVWYLIFDGIEHQVHPEWMFHPVDGIIQLGLRRVDERRLNPDATHSHLGGTRAVWESFRRSCTGGSEMFFSAAFFALVMFVVLSPLGDAMGLKAVTGKFTSALMSLGQHLPL